jgi:3'-5' exoribonuclease
MSLKKQFVQNITEGETVEDVFLASDKTISQKRDGQSYLRLTLSDKTGSLKGVMWDHADAVRTRFSSGDFVQIKGVASAYQGTLQITIKSLTKCQPESVEIASFVPATQKDVDVMFDRLKRLAESIQSQWLKALFQEFWSDSDFVQQFKTAPAAKQMHHACIGGLLEHTLSVALLAEKVASHYAGINRDLLLAGAILHDIGKIQEFDYRTTIDYTSAGRLLSHIIIGIHILDEKLDRIGPVPEEDAMLLRHLMVSHHGKKEFGSPEAPKTIEALVLNYVDEIDSKVAAVRETINATDAGEKWTPYHRILERHFYISEKPESPGIT